MRPRVRAAVALGGLLLERSASLAVGRVPSSVRLGANLDLREEEVVRVDGREVYESDEFGVGLDVSAAFFRSDSRVSRDVACLAASYGLRGRSERDSVRVVDAFAGSGARSLRYARDLHGGIVDVTCNEPNDETRLAFNVRAASSSTNATFRLDHRATEG